MFHFTESVLEEAVLEYLGSLKGDIQFGPEIAPGEPGAERSDYREVLLAARLCCFPPTLFFKKSAG